MKKAGKLASQALAHVAKYVKVFYYKMLLYQNNI